MPARAPVGVGKRAVVLVGGPVAPYSRALRIARALAAEGFAVEIAAIAVPGLPEREHVGLRPAGVEVDPADRPKGQPGIELRRYRPRGWQAFIGATDLGPGTLGPAHRPNAWRQRLLRLARVPAAALLEIRRWVLWPHTVRGWWVALRRELRPADLYHACGVLALPAALDARRRHPAGPGGGPARVIYDVIDLAAESNTAAGMPEPVRRRIARLDAAWAGDADALTTVNHELAERLRAESADREVTVLPNLPESTGRPGSAGGAVAINEAAGLPAETKIVLVHGRLGPGLGLEEAAEAIRSVPSAALVLLGFGRGFVASRGRDQDPRYAGRHVTLQAVHPDEIVAWTAAADVCLIPLPPISENQRLSTPNKFWEAIVAGTPVVIVRGMTAMERLVADHDLGAIASSAEASDLAVAIIEVLDRLETEGSAWRSRIAAFAQHDGGWAAAAATYRSLVGALLEGPG